MKENLRLAWLFAKCVAMVWAIIIILAAGFVIFTAPIWLVIWWVWR